MDKSEHVTTLINDNINAILTTSTISVSQTNTTQGPQPKHLEFQYGWCEGGMRQQELLGTANIYGSSGFLWLLTLRPHQWETIYVGSKIPSFLYKQIDAIWGKRLLFTSDRNPKANIDFVACLPSEIVTLVETTNPRVIFLLGRARRIKMTGRQFLIVRHSDVGGVTTHVGYFILTHCPPVKLKETVHRSIGSVIEHKRHISGTSSSETYISPGDLLPFNALGTPIRLPTRWSSSGFGTRYLVGTEICTAFDLPR